MRSKTNETSSELSSENREVNVTIVTIQSRWVRCSQEPVVSVFDKRVSLARCLVRLYLDLETEMSSSPNPKTSGDKDENLPSA